MLAVERPGSFELVKMETSPPVLEKFCGVATYFARKVAKSIAVCVTLTPIARQKPTMALVSCVDSGNPGKSIVHMLSWRSECPDCARSVFASAGSYAYCGALRS